MEMSRRLILTIEIPATHPGMDRRLGVASPGAIWHLMNQ